MYIPGTHRFYSQLLRLVWRFDYFGKRVAIALSCEIPRAAAPYIHIGNDVILAKDVWLNVPRVSLPPVKNHPVIKIGSGTAIGRRCTISGTHRVEIGRNVICAPGVFISDHSHEFVASEVPIKDQGVTESGTIIIEEGCWFGHNSAIISHRGGEVRLGRNTVVGANAVVNKSSPAYSVLVGNPARNVGPMVVRNETS